MLQNHKYIFNKFSHEFLHGEPYKLVVDAADCLGKVVIIDAANEIGHEVMPDLRINAGENKLKKIKDTGAIVIMTDIFEDDITAGKNGVLVTLVFEQDFLSAKPSMTENTKDV